MEQQPRAGGCWLAGWLAPMKTIMHVCFRKKDKRGRAALLNAPPFFSSSFNYAGTVLAVLAVVNLMPRENSHAEKSLLPAPPRADNVIAGNAGRGRTVLHSGA